MLAVPRRICARNGPFHDSPPGNTPLNISDRGMVGCGFVSETDLYEEMHHRKMIVAMIPAIVLSLLSPSQANAIPERHFRPKSIRANFQNVLSGQHLTTSPTKSTY